MKVLCFQHSTSTDGHISCINQHWIDSLNLVRWLSVTVANWYAILSDLQAQDGSRGMQMSFDSYWAGCHVMLHALKRSNYSVYHAEKLLHDHFPLFFCTDFCSLIKWDLLLCRFSCCFTILCAYRPGVSCACLPPTTFDLHRPPECQEAPKAWYMTEV